MKKVGRVQQALLEFGKATEAKQPEIPGSVGIGRALKRF